MKRISLVFLGQTGAGPVYSLEMARALARNENVLLQVVINENVTNIDAWRSAFKTSNVDFHVVKAYKHTKISVFLNFFNYVRKYKLFKIIKMFYPEVLYIPFGLMWARFVYAILPRSIKIIDTIHDVTPHDKFNISEAISKVLAWGSERHITGYVILNQMDKHIVIERYRRPVAVIPHASFDYYFNNILPKTSLSYTIGFLGRIEPYKGLDLLVNALEKTKTEGLKLLIAGSGVIGEPLETKIRNNKHIILINRYIKDEEFQPLLEKVDFVVLPYKRASQSGVIPMCYAFGKTVIATNVGALIEQVPTGTGIITAPNEDSIAEKIDWFYSNPQSILEYGKNARQYAETELSWEHSAELLLDFIELLQ